MCRQKIKKLNLSVKLFMGPAPCAGGWASWIRTSGMRESKSLALPLGDSPIQLNYFIIYSGFCQ